MTRGLRRYGLLAALACALAPGVASATPLVPAEQLQTTKKIVADFQTGLGKELHAELKNRVMNV